MIGTPTGYDLTLKDHGQWDAGAYRTLGGAMRAPEEFLKAAAL